MVLRIAGRRSMPTMPLRCVGASPALKLDEAVIFEGRPQRRRACRSLSRLRRLVFPSSIEKLRHAAGRGPWVRRRGGRRAHQRDTEIAGGAALLCNAQEPRDIAEKILRVLDDPALRQTLRERGLARAKAFSWPDCARRTAAILREAAAPRVARAAVAPSSSR